MKARRKWKGESEGLDGRAGREGGGRMCKGIQWVCLMGRCKSLGGGEILFAESIDERRDK